MHRGEVYWANLPSPWGHRPVVVVSREHAVQVRSQIIVAQISTKVRGIQAEVKLGTQDGLPKPCAVNCDVLLTIPKSLVQRHITNLSPQKTREVEEALRFALGLD